MSPFTNLITLEPKKKRVPSNDLEDYDEYLEQAEGFFLEWEREKPKRFSPEQIQKFTSNFSKSLGSGACGDVYQGKYNGQRVAIKVLKKEVLADNIKDQFVAEVSTLGKTHHRNLVKLYGFCFQPKMKALVYEFMERESLDKFLKEKSSIKWEMLCNIAIGTAKGLSYLHEDCQPSIIHYDIKPSNILLDSKFSAKIGDFGLAKLLKIDVTHVTTSKFRGTPYYSAPELSLPYLKVNHKCDVYSYGMMLFDIVSMGKHKPQETEHWFPRQVWDKYQKGKLEEVMADWIEAKDRVMAKRILMIALSCVEFWASERPSMKDVVRLLEGSKDPLMPHNCVLPSPQVSPSNRKGELRGVHDRRKIVNSREKEKVQVNIDEFLWELKFYPPPNVLQKIHGYDWVEGVSEEVRRDQASKPNLNKKSHFPLFMFALFLILFLKFHVAPLFVWFKKLV